MTSLFPLRKPTYPQSFMLIYGFLFELWVSNLNEEKKKKMKNFAQYIYDGEGLGNPYIQSTTVLCDRDGRGLGPLYLYIQKFQFALSLSVIRF